MDMAEQQVTQNNISEQQHIERAEQHSDLPRDWKYHRNYPKDNLLSQLSEMMMTRKALREYYGNCAFVSQLDPNSFVEAQNDESWILAI